MAVFHADPHAGNLMYDETNRELIVMDWALADHLSLESRRQLVLLAVMMVLRNPEGVREAIHARSSRGRQRDRDRLIDFHVDRFFRESPKGWSPGTLDAMRLLDEIALAGVHFPTSLFFFRKSVFTLDGVLQGCCRGQYPDRLRDRPGVFDQMPGQLRAVPRPASV